MCDDDIANKKLCNADIANKELCNAENLDTTKDSLCKEAENIMESPLSDMTLLIYSFR